MLRWDLFWWGCIIIVPIAVYHTLEFRSNFHLTTIAVWLILPKLSCIFILFFDIFSRFYLEIVLSVLLFVLLINDKVVCLWLFLCCSDTENEQTVNPGDVILVEGILVFYFKEIRDMFNMKLFVDTDADTRLSRRGKSLGGQWPFMCLYSTLLK